MITKYKKDISELESTMLLSKEPTTVILDNVSGFPDELTGENNSLAFRITNHKICLELIEAIGQPLVSTSANLSGEPTEKNFKDLPDELKNKVDYIIKEHSEDSLHKPSVIVKVNNNNIQYIRK